MGVLELLRRACLLAGFSAAVWFALWSPPAILEVRRADFAAEYERRYGERQYPVMGAIELGREFIRRNTHPGSLRSFIERSTAGRLIEAGGPHWHALFGRVAAGPAWFAPDEPPFAALRPRIEAIYRRSQWTSMYLAVNGGFLEFRLPRTCSRATPPGRRTGARSTSAATTAGIPAAIRFAFIVSVPTAPASRT